MKSNIMFVDDSISVLESLRWIFMDEPYYLFAFDSPLDALSVIKSLEFAVVVADQSMPEMAGIEFLEKVKQRCDMRWLHVSLTKNPLMLVC